jgi:hypothetical protein
MCKPLGISAFTNLFCEECEWQSVSESLSAGAYVGFLFPCYSTPIFTGMVTFASFVSRPCDAERRKGRQRAVERILASR